MIRREVLLTALSCLVTAINAADITCEWRGPIAADPNGSSACFSESLNGLTLVIPANTDRIASDALTLCRSAWNPAPKDADILFIMDNSGSMEKGENSGGFNTPPGDPFGVRDRIIRRGILQLRAQAGSATAGFISFFGLGGNQDYTVELELETEKLQHPLDISVLNPQGAGNLNILLHKVWKHNPNEALLPKAGVAAREAREAKEALTFWSEALTLARNWFSPESSYARSPNRAIILISDGAIGDWGDVQRLIPSLPPVYGIHLGNAATAEHLQNLSAQTRGAYRIISPIDTLAFEAVMFEIINNLMGISPPGPVRMVREAQGINAADTALAVGLDVDSSGNLKVRLDGDLGLVPGGSNQVRVQYDQGPSMVEHILPLQVSGPKLPASNSDFTCADPSGIRQGPGAIKGIRPGRNPHRDALGKQRPLPDGMGKPPVRLFPAPAGK